MRRLRRAAALAAWGAVALALWPVIGAATPAVASPGAQVAAAVPSSQLTLQLTAMSPQVLAPGGTLHVAGTVSNPTGQDVTGMHVNVTIDSLGVLSTLKGIAAWQSHPSSDLTWIAGQRSLGAPVPAHGSVPFAFDISAHALGLSDSSPFGPRGLVVELSDGTNTVAQESTFVVWQPDAAPHIDLGILGAVAPAGDNAASDAQRTSSVVAALDGLGADIAVDGALAGDKAYSETITQVAAMSAAGIWVLPWGDTDVAALAHAGGDVLYSDAEALSTDQLVPALDAASEPIRTTLAWPETLDEQTLRLASAGGAHTVVAPASDVVDSSAADVASGTTSATPGIYRAKGGDTTPIMLADDALANAVLACDPGNPLDVQRIYALVAARVASGVTHVILPLPRDWDPTPTQRDVLSLVQGLPWVTPTSLESLAAVTPDALELPERTVSRGELPEGDVASLVASRDQVSQFASVTKQPLTVIDQVVPELLAPLSTSLRFHQSEQQDRMAQATAAANRITSSVSVLSTGSLTFLATDAAIPVTLRNTYSQDVTVWVDLKITDPRLQAPDGAQVTVPAGAEATVRIPVHAVANANVQVAAEVRVGEDGAVLATGGEMRVRVRADWENWGTWSVLCLAGVALIIGLILGVRKRTRAAAIAAQEREAAAAAAQRSDSGPEGPSS